MTHTTALSLAAMLLGLLAGCSSEAKSDLPETIAELRDVALQASDDAQAFL